MAAAATTFAAILLLAAAAAAAAADHGRINNSNDPNNGLKGLELVAHVCKNASWYYTRPKHNMTQQYCESTLRSDNRSAAAESPRDLALVAVELLDRAAAAMDAMVDGAKKRGNETSKQVLTLEFCRADYLAMAHAIPVCRALIQGYKPTPEKEFVFSEAEVNHSLCANRLRFLGSDWRDLVQYDMYDDLVQFDMYDDRMLKQVAEVYQLTILVSAMVEQMLGVIADSEFSEESEYL